MAKAPVVEKVGVFCGLFIGVISIEPAVDVLGTQPVRQQANNTKKIVILFCIAPPKSTNWLVVEPIRTTTNRSNAKVIPDVQKKLVIIKSIHVRYCITKRR